MALYLVESVLSGTVKDQEGLEQAIAQVEQRLAPSGINVLEVQVSRDLSRAFLIFEGESRQLVNDGLREVGFPVTLIKPVRLIGQETEAVKRKLGEVNYLVEWNLPEGITMDQYLERKKNNSVHYAEVPEVSFSRTYVCEDMTKCLCFYDAPDEAAVKRARKAVKAPIDSITEILPKPKQ
ncbi:DUF4242 domain-containing protein [Paenibacillus allorhizosphaerae]|uniref:DUF4242 domain-containing protein n=1 Tax=Paenibacillus allorhizosphaerae TaxID=2849866 RepID=A0ABN7TVJ2_9BACL|nr:DUF4242 domain-containing protein [Paenibacillus allorhizosphaerae]CAG7657476.1 hypothetical protein PAECIP111802_06738 [Paenibacillus allorhizosphaerae]